MNCKLFGFAKKKNSTKQPDLTTGTDVSIQIKEPTNVTAPILILNLKQNGQQIQPTIYNYVYIPLFLRYYFITDWRYINGAWEAYSIVDVLASFKSSIGNLTEYIVRSSFASNGYISDGLYPTHTNIARTINTSGTGLTQSGVYCLGVINNEGGNTQGAVTYYWMSGAQLGSFKNYLLSNNFLSDNGLNSLTEMSQDLLKCVYNPYQYITSCKYFPISKPGISSDTDIHLGWWTLTGYQGEKMNAGGYVTNIVSRDIPTPAHPQATLRGSYLNHAPYTERYISHPLIGTILLDSNKIDAGDRILLNMSVDGVSGETAVMVLNTTKANTVLFSTNIQIAVDIPLAQISQDYINMARTAVDSTGNVISSALRGDVAGAISGAVTGVLNTLESSIPIVQSSGGNANLSVFSLDLVSCNIFRQLVEEDNAHRGRPLCENRQINTMSGYMLCSDAHAEIVCFDSEREQIVTYMNTGFYYE